MSYDPCDGFVNELLPVLTDIRSLSGNFKGLTTPQQEALQRIESIDAYPILQNLDGLKALKKHLSSYSNDIDFAIYTATHRILAGGCEEWKKLKKHLECLKSLCYQVASYDPDDDPFTNL